NASHTPAFELILTDWIPLASDSAALLDRLNILLCQGQLGADSRLVILNTLDAQTALTDTERVRLAIYLVMTSPEAAILR
ncbi:MAG: hypothetical protein AAF571_12655, partial [Verrucomicrobiota bacterium]